MGMKNAGYTFGIDTLLKYRPKHAALLAGISQAWAAVEISLLGLFGFLVASRYFTSRTGAQIDPISNELWDSFVLIDHRMSLLRAALNTRIQDDALLEDFEQLAKRVRRSATSRNTFVHAAWAVSGAYPEHIIRTKVRPFDHDSSEPTNIDELWKVIKAIQETASAVQGFRLKIESHVYSRFPAVPPPDVTEVQTVYTIAVTMDSPEVYDPPIFNELKG